MLDSDEANCGFWMTMPVRISGGMNPSFIRLDNKIRCKYNLDAKKKDGEEGRSWDADVRKAVSFARLRRLL